jgi:hypothetical protein
LNKNKSASSAGDTISKAEDQLKELKEMTNPKLHACKIVERHMLCQTKEALIVSEIQN